MLEILCAFILGGCLCGLFQVIGNYTKSIPPKILLIGIGAGSLFAAFGITGALGAFGGAGIGIMVIGFGEGVLIAVHEAIRGNFLPALINTGVVIALSAIGILCGVARQAISKKKAE